MEKLLILDSNSLMNRAFYALPKLTNNEGTNTNAIYGFLNMLLKIKKIPNFKSLFQNKKMKKSC